MKMPNKNTVFLPIEELKNYSDKDKYVCCGVVFSPETENNHFDGCPPYIEIFENIPSLEGEHLYFEVPEIVAYYAKTHPCYTMAGRERRIEEGKRLMKQEIKNLLGL